MAFFLQQYSTKSGFVGLYQKKFILLETLPYNKTDNYLLYKDYDLTYMKFQDKLVSDKLDIIETAYSQLAAIAQGSAQPSTTGKQAGQLQRFGRVDPNLRRKR